MNQSLRAASCRLALILALSFSSVSYADSTIPSFSLMYPGAIKAICNVQRAARCQVQSSDCAQILNAPDEVACSYTPYYFFAALGIMALAIFAFNYSRRPAPHKAKNS